MLNSGRKLRRNVSCSYEPAPLALVGGFFITESLGMPGIYVRVKQTMPVYVFVYSFFCAIVLEEQSEETSDLGHQD